jgi:hypothetical protein
MEEVSAAILSLALPDESRITAGFMVLVAAPGRLVAEIQDRAP